MRPSLRAYAVAAAREETSSLVKMLLTCRATVRSLMPSAEAICRFDRPAAMSATTFTSRFVSPPGDSPRRVRDSPSTSSRSGVAPR